MNMAGGPLLAENLSDTIALLHVAEQHFGEFAAAVLEDDETLGLFGDLKEWLASSRVLLTNRQAEVSAGSPVTQQAESIKVPASHSSVREEALLQNLLSGYSLITQVAALSQILEVTSDAVADTPTATASRGLGAEAEAAAARLWKLLPSRSKIAFNMLTISEVDPSVDTKMSDDRLTQE